MKRGRPLKRRKGIRWQSPKRRKQNRERRKVAEATFGLQPMCAVPSCGQRADDVHEPLTRARGGSIVDPANMQPLCRPHHDEIDGEPPWAYDLGLLKHSWDRRDGTLRLPDEWGGVA